MPFNSMTQARDILNILFVDFHLSPQVSIADTYNILVFCTEGHLLRYSVVLVGLPWLVKTVDFIPHVGKLGI